MKNKFRVHIGHWLSKFSKINAIIHMKNFVAKENNFIK